MCCLRTSIPPSLPIMPRTLAWQARLDKDNTAQCLTWTLTLSPLHAISTMFVITPFSWNCWAISLLQPFASSAMAFMQQFTIAGVSDFRKSAIVLTASNSSIACFRSTVVHTIRNARSVDCWQFMSDVSVKSFTSLEIIPHSSITWTLSSSSAKFASALAVLFNMLVCSNVVSITAKI